ncbi:MAG TPA: response regulator transcription factor [Candidatus Sulfotelmatobacter sp.]|nr:response regulator transcription factor [Candidatus Sulfotelmatobacter sp.]
MSAVKILVVDDEPQMRRALRTSLNAHGYDVVEAQSGEEAVRKLDAEVCDFVLLDMNLPGRDGLATCRTIRAGSEVPIIIVSVRSSERDKVAVLNAGADDYVTKPFGVPELLARVEAVKRRKPVTNRPPEVLVLDGVRIDFETHQVTTPEGEEHLTPKEIELLHFMVSHAGQVIPHRRLLQALWGADYGGEVEYLRVLVNQLRKKIERDPHQPKYLLTEPWVGYRFAPPPPAS